MSPAIEAYKKDVDRTLLIENLRLTPQQRFDKFEAFMKSVMELHEAGQQHRRQQSKSNQDLSEDAK
jgi:hypothetical protein